MAGRRRVHGSRSANRHRHHPARLFDPDFGVAGNWQEVRRPLNPRLTLVDFQADGGLSESNAD